MSLTTGLNIARSSLSASGALASTVSRNIVGLNDPNYSRRSANVVTLPGGGVTISSVTRSTDKVLLDAKFDASSRSLMQQAISDNLTRLSATVGDPQIDASPAALIGKLAQSLQLYATSPQEPTAGFAAVASAKDLAAGLNDATTTVQTARAQADADLAVSIERLESLLAQLEDVNNTIVGRSGQSADVNDNLDQRDKILSQISEEIGIKTVARDGNDIAVFTDGGVTLFDGRARSVAFQPTANFAAGTAGKAVYIDNVPVTGDSAAMALHAGRLVGLVGVRDQLAPAYQNQLDEIARGLISAFSESDRSASPSLPDVPGLFTWDGAPGMPGGGLVPGLAGAIKVSANVDPGAGGDATLLRDGGISDPGNAAYTYNQTGATGFVDRLQQLMDNLAAPRGFDAAAGLGANATLAVFAASSAGWLEQARQSASNDAEYGATFLNRATESLANATGVNLDEEMTVLLEIERSYQASAKLIAAIDSLFNNLLEAV